MEKGKLIYVTKKQVAQFIKTGAERLKMDKTEFLIEVEDVLFDLKQYPDDCLNQIKFYTKVLKNWKRKICT